MLPICHSRAVLYFALVPIEGGQVTTASQCGPNQAVAVYINATRAERHNTWPIGIAERLFVDFACACCWVNSNQPSGNARRRRPGKSIDRVSSDAVHPPQVDPLIDALVEFSITV